MHQPRSSHWRRTLSACLLTCFFGCGEEPPPPPAPPPPPPPPPSPEEVAQSIRPYWFLLHERAFLPNWETTFRGSYLPRNVSDPDREKDVIRNKAPSGVTSEESGLVLTPKSTDLFGGGRPQLTSMSPSDGTDLGPRSRVLRIYRLQALQDLMEERYHRANTFYKMLRTEYTPVASDSRLATLTRFFEEVPDPVTYDNVTGLVKAYIDETVTRVILQGEHAAILLSALQDDAGNFLLDELATQVELITLPWVNSVIRYGESNALRTPPVLPETRDHLQSLLADIKVSHDPALWTKDFFTPAASRQRADGYKELIRDLVSAREGGMQSRSAVSLIPELWKQERNIEDWTREKELVSRWPWYLISADVDLPLGLLQKTSPVVFDDSPESASPNTLTSKYLTRSLNKSTATHLRAWCSDPSTDFPISDQARKRKANRKSPDAQEDEANDYVLDDGTAHFLLGWYFLEHGNPYLARRTWIIGSVALSKAAEALPSIEASDPPVRRKKLLLQFNAMRLLTAAGSIRRTPPGANSSAGSYLSEFRVLLAAWRADWLKAGLEGDDCREVIGETLEAISDIQARNQEIERQPERYFFPDYRFTYGDVPDCLVDAGIQDPTIYETEELFLQLTDALSAIPTKFPKETIERWTLIEDINESSPKPSQSKDDEASRAPE